MDFPNFQDLFSVSMLNFGGVHIQYTNGHTEKNTIQWSTTGHQQQPTSVRRVLMRQVLSRRRDESNLPWDKRAKPLAKPHGVTAKWWEMGSFFGSVCWNKTMENVHVEMDFFLIMHIKSLNIQLDDLLSSRRSLRKSSWWLNNGPLTIVEIVWSTNKHFRMVMTDWSIYNQ